MIGLILIATGGARYTQFLDPLLRSTKKFLPEHEVVLFSETGSAAHYGHQFSLDGLLPTIHSIYQPDLGWPRATLMRYHAMNRAEKFLHRYDHLFYMDIDMLVCSKIEESEICSDGLTAVLHPGFPESFERDPRSTAFMPDNGTYYQGCLVGGATGTFLSMTNHIARNIDVDDSKGIMAFWHDESHLNWYLHRNKPTITLSPAYAYPAEHYLKHPETWMGVPIQQFSPKIRHLEKKEQGQWKNRHA